MLIGASAGVMLYGAYTESPNWAYFWVGMALMWSSLVPLYLRDREER